MAVLQQDQVFGAQRAGADGTGRGQGVVGGGGGHDLVVADAGVGDAGRVIGQGDDGGVDLARLQRRDQAGRQILADEQLQAGIGGLHRRQFGRQQEGGDGRDDAQAEAAGQQAAGVLGRLDQILCAGQHVLGPAHGLGAHGGHDDGAARPFDHRRAQDALQLLHPGAEGGLADVGGLCGARETAVFGQKLEILKLSQGGEHGCDIGSVYAEIKDNRFDLSDGLTPNAPVITRGNAAQRRAAVPSTRERRP